MKQSNAVVAEPVVSVLIPVYNAEKYFSRCLDSILNQSYKNIEVILVDDGSPDKCGLICDEYTKKDSRIKVIHQKNQGVSVARNVALDNASGDYTLFIDSDDTIHPDCIADCVKTAVAHEADMVCFNFAFIKNGILQAESKYYRDNMSFEEIIDKQLVNVNGGCSLGDKMLKKSLWDGIRLPIDLQLEDSYIVPRLFAKVKNVVALGKAYYFYNMDNELSIMHNLALDDCIADYYRFHVMRERMRYFKDRDKHNYLLYVGITLRFALRCFNTNIYLQYLEKKQLTIIEDFIKKYGSVTTNG